MRLYQLTLEDFTREFSSLPDKYKILLFKLQTSYCFKEEPLNEFEIAGIANAEIPLDENLLRFLNNYFVQTKEGLWKSPSVDSQSEQLENLIEKEVQKRVARALAGMKGGLTKARNRKNQNSPVFDEEISVNEVPEEQQTIGEEPEEIKQTSGKPLANGYQTPSKTVANSWQNPSKVVANAKQTAGKTLANENFATTDKAQSFDFQEKIENLINFLFYCISIKSKDNSKISYTKDFSNKKIFVITPDLIQSTFSRNDITNPLYIVTPDLFEVKYKNILLNNLKIINNLETDNLCEIEQKINRAVNWIGQSLRNDDLTQSFLFLAMAMECLLTYNEGFISPSITYQLAETCAFLCADTLEERIQIEKTIKDLYRKRSAIVHSGGTDISLQDYYSFIPILKITIGKLLELVENFNIKKPDDLCQYIKKCKYD